MIAAYYSYQLITCLVFHSLLTELAKAKSPYSMLKGSILKGKSACYSTE